MVTRRDPFFRRVHPRFRFHDIGIVVGVANAWVMVVVARAVPETLGPVLIGGYVLSVVFTAFMIYLGRTFMEKRFEQLDEEMITYLQASGLQIPKRGPGD